MAGGSAAPSPVAYQYIFVRFMFVSIFNSIYEVGKCISNLRKAERERNGARGCVAGREARGRTGKKDSVIL